MIIRFHWCYIGLALNTFNNHHCRTWKSLIAHVTRDYQIHNLFMHHDGELVNQQRKCSCSREIWRSSVHRCETQCQTLIRLFRSQSQWTTFLWFIANPVRCGGQHWKKIEKKKGRIIFIFSSRISALLSFLFLIQIPNKIALRISMEIYLKLRPGLFANRKETMAFVWRSFPRNRI